jgi:protein MpaA
MGHAVHRSVAAAALSLAALLPVSTVAAQRTGPSGAPPSTVSETRVVGTSVQGRPIVAHRVGSGRLRVVVIGVIHGDEDAGLAITDLLQRTVPPSGVELWIVPTMNPDGTALGVRGNANRVDLNRNFPYRWAPMGEPGYWQYAGPSRASEPETAAMVAFLRDLKPALGIWYHQDLFMISPGTGLDGRIRAHYARATGLPLRRITGGRYTGVAATWQRSTIPGALAFVVELGPALTPAEAAVHAAAVLDTATVLRDVRR